MLDANLEWTEQLGEAYLADSAAVMDAVQRLRQPGLEPAPRRKVYFRASARNTPAV
jgi:Protein of unknown function (DUF3300)